MGYSIWLGFQGESEAKLQNVIASLSKAFAGPVFQPHLTLVGDLEVDLVGAQRVADIFAGTAMPEELIVRDVGISGKYFMALYLAVNIPSELQRTREQVASSANPASYELDAPHVSLLYSHAEQSALARHQSLLRNDFVDRKLEVAGLSIVRSSKSVPISDWRIEDRIALFPTAKKPLIESTRAKEK